MVATVQSDRVYFAVRLTPNAARNAVIGWIKNDAGQPFLKVTVTTVPENGKANQALIFLLAKEWKIPKSTFQIEKGETDRNKILSVPKNYEMLLGLDKPESS